MSHTHFHTRSPPCTSTYTHSRTIVPTHARTHDARSTHVRSSRTHSSVRQQRDPHHPLSLSLIYTHTPPPHTDTQNCDPISSTHTNVHHTPLSHSPSRGRFPRQRTLSPSLTLARSLTLALSRARSLSSLARARSLSHTHRHTQRFGGSDRQRIHSTYNFVVYVSIRQHPSASVSIRQHTSAYVSIRQHTCQHTSAYGGDRQSMHSDKKNDRLDRVD
jgi:hypothetical protein